MNDELLKTIDEQTEGGFVLFYTDGEGNAIYQPYTDSTAITAGLLLHAKAQAEALEEVTRSIIVESMKG